MRVMSGFQPRRMGALQGSSRSGPSYQPHRLDLHMLFVEFAADSPRCWVHVPCARALVEASAG
jgi:hypothetical protein